MSEVSVVGCDSYDYEKVKAALAEAINAVDGFKAVKEGTKVAIKANLVASAAPDSSVCSGSAMRFACRERSERCCRRFSRRSL